MVQQITLATKNLKGNLKAFKTTNISATTIKNIAMQRQMYALFKAVKMYRKNHFEDYEKVLVTNNLT